MKILLSIPAHISIFRRKIFWETYPPIWNLQIDFFRLQYKVIYKIRNFWLIFQFQRDNELQITTDIICPDFFSHTILIYILFIIQKKKSTGRDLFYSKCNCMFYLGRWIFNWISRFGYWDKNVGSAHSIFLRNTVCLHALVRRSASL